MFLVNFVQIYLLNEILFFFLRSKMLGSLLHVTAIVQCIHTMAMLLSKPIQLFIGINV